MKLNDERERLGISIEILADFVGMSYIDLGEVFRGQAACPKEKRDLIEFFLIKNYTKCIGDADFN